MISCDYPSCNRVPYAEVYYKQDGKTRWSYLCHKHFEQEKDRPHIMMGVKLPVSERFTLGIRLLKGWILRCES